jgi:hypothetical protein
MFRPITAAAVVALATLSCASSAGAQTIYTPVQYQYGSDQYRYYYGGSDPAVFDRAERQRCLDRMSDYPTTSSRHTYAAVHYRLTNQYDRVYADCVPHMNARVFGYLPVDAANDANANVPTYFRKSDLLRAADVLPDGTRVVPAQAQPVVDVDAVRAERAATQPVIKPRAIIIIPKNAKRTTPDKQVASAAQ